jgi:hypothetical protein
MSLGGKVYDVPLPPPGPLTKGNGCVKVRAGEGQFGVDKEWSLPPGAVVLPPEEVAARDDAELVARQLGSVMAGWLASASEALVTAALHGDAVALARVADPLLKYGLPPIPRATGAAR